MQAIKHIRRRRATTIQQNLDIALCATQNPINKQELGLDISLVTIGKRLRESKLFCRVARQKELKCV
jgi:hypothetical protein